MFVGLILPVPGVAVSGAAQQPACQGKGCAAVSVPYEKWAARLDGTWSAGTVSQSPGDGTSGDGSTVPAAGPGYVAVGGGTVVVGVGLSLASYQLDNRKQRWQVTLGASAGTTIMSVRAWPGVVTAGLLAPDGRTRTEVVIDAVTGAELRRYPAAVFGGAVAASAATTVVIGRSAVTSYDNATGRVRWRRPSADGQSWQADGQTLFVAESPASPVRTARVSALRVINLSSGTTRTLASPQDHPFSGTLALAEGGAVLFASASRVTAYSGSTGGVLWSTPHAVPEGTDPAAGLIYLTAADGTLTGVAPLTGKVRAQVTGVPSGNSAGLYVVRGGVALGLSGGANGTAWSYDMATGQVNWTSDALPWPHFYSDLSGLGGSAAVSGDIVAVTACPHLAASPGLCADPELVVISL